MSLKYVQVSWGNSIGVFEEERADFIQNIVDTKVAGVIQLGWIEDDDGTISSSTSDSVSFSII